jgi:hypothetical protein
MYRGSFDGIASRGEESGTFQICRFNLQVFDFFETTVIFLFSTFFYDAPNFFVKIDL